MAINVATDVKDSWWAWVAVGLLTVVSAGVSVWLQPSDAPPKPPATSQTVEVANEPVPQTGPITQHATAKDNAIIQQAGRDITNPPQPH
ncbi:hypothetical protein [Amycolatopsis mediterranei]|uniref:hypothetical protein n=1 Tax=Amycolatopsis mediterranei TaxID=33910 RepID=UPI00114CF8EC|nr:hypothetical protein [Amycolatopsis mediterranei]UZF71949.1 hypothetical protein ISP_005252 [Amycolatopsis mediterranei]